MDEVAFEGFYFAVESRLAGTVPSRVLEYVRCSVTLNAAGLQVRHAVISTDTPLYTVAWPLVTDWDWDGDRLALHLGSGAVVLLLQASVEGIEAFAAGIQMFCRAADASSSHSVSSEKTLGMPKGHISDSALNEPQLDPRAFSPRNYLRPVSTEIVVTRSSLKRRPAEQEVRSVHRSGE